MSLISWTSAAWKYGQGGQGAKETEAAAGAAAAARARRGHGTDDAANQSESNASNLEPLSVDELETRMEIGKGNALLEIKAPLG